MIECGEFDGDLSDFAECAVCWTDTRLRMALYRSGAGFVTTPAPPAHPVGFTTRSVAAAGDFVVVAWQASDRRLAVSMRRL